MHGVSWAVGLADHQALPGPLQDRLQRLTIFQGNNMLSELYSFQQIGKEMLVRIELRLMENCPSIMKKKKKTS